MSQARDLPSSVEIVPGRVPHCSSSYRSSPSCATDPDPDDEDGEDGQFNAKQIPKQIPTRAIVCERGGS